ncbi:PolC-type DNA polymerase III [Ammoniphilus sp. CFH 90114]|uniref:PolC-type DNA polymerase III n=1 Tax=Ammoniphilus sp. CFH 90114 TaxID=2493665 RepID=UPI00100E6956|nr:PolC-type DNA polymerase III [Ammoniphilus sp. CFH 90114]RXT15151.1 PolC-type DNA polymerase III [Ammoniphilus sp. CFH 90114]
MQQWLEQKERFQLLLRQADIPEEYRSLYFAEGRIDRLELTRQNKQWTFYIELENILPSLVYRAFIQRLQATFSHIAVVDCYVSYMNPVDIQAFITDYWGYIFDILAGQLTSLAGIMKETVPDIAGNKLILSVTNEITLSMVKKKEVDRLISATMFKMLGTHVQVEFKVVESDEDYQAFLEQRMQEDRSRALEALIETEKEKEKGESTSLAEANVEFLIGYKIQDDPSPIQQIVEEEKRITIQGQVFSTEIRELKSGRSLLTFRVTDYTDSISVKIFSRDKEDLVMMKAVKEGMWVKVRGRVTYDQFARELAMEANDVNEIKPKNIRQDTATEKRIELHLHTPMSTMDAITPVKKLVAQAAKWGHKAIAITDHAGVQSFPEAYSAAQKAGIKVIYGLEANIVNDGAPIAYNPSDLPLKEATYVVFDVETTGLSVVYNQIIELAAVKVRNGEIIDRFERFANPHENLTNTIIELTGITDDMLVDAPEIDQVLNDFREFVGDAVLVAHNAKFDMGFVNTGYRKLNQPELKNSVIDTLELARFLLPELKNHRLNTISNYLNVELVSHHRAVYDAEATGNVLWKMVLRLEERNMTNLLQLNDHMGRNGDWMRQRPFHGMILVQNQVGLRNLYILVSKAHTEYLHRVPRIPRSELIKYREGLIIGSGCERGELFETVMQKSIEEAEEVAKFYDYLEIQPTYYNLHLIEKELVKDEQALRDINRKIMELGQKLGKPVVATGNVHYLDPHEKIYRQILVRSLGGASMLKPDKLPDAHFPTTNEFLDEFKYLGEDQAYNVVIAGPSQVNEWIEDVKPIPDKLYTPKIDGANEDTEVMSYERAKRIYGDPLPELVQKRLEKELNSIIGHGFAVIYLISHKLVKKSLDDGYLVGSRGSVGSSFVATMMEITEVNPLPPHYVCPSCKHSEFIEDGSVACGYDLPDRDCPQCGTKYNKDGHDIPFETFLGFKGDKVPDIDLNFSGEYQPRAHNYTKVLFGPDYVYRAGTIGTVADKTAYGFVKKYEEEKGLQLKNTEVLRLASGCTGVKRTTGQHPGGIIVVPDYTDIYDFCPIQFPADDKESEWKTTHFDFHSIHDNLLKLDILGHDDPTAIRMLQDLTGLDPKGIPTDDKAVMGIFSSPESLGVSTEQIRTNTGTLGIPEFGTKFVRQMLEDTKPSTFAELVQISGLSHGTDVWLNNAQELIRKGTCTLKDVIGCRDDIMVYLMYKGLEPSLAFKIMESVRKGKGLTPEMEEDMLANKVPDWYIWSCKQIKYMFPKAHATAYVLMAVRIAYFKVHYPLEYYATYFTVRADDFDIPIMVKGSAAIRAKIEEIERKGNDAQPKEKNLLTVLEIALEMCERGFHFKNIDLYRSHATQFLLDGKGLIPPFNSLPGVGTNAAISIAASRENGEFLSIEDLQQRSKVSKTVIEYLQEQGCLQGLPASNQLSLF